MTSIPLNFDDLSAHKGHNVTLTRDFGTQIFGVLSSVKVDPNNNKIRIQISSANSDGRAARSPYYHFLENISAMTCNDCK